MLLRPWILVLLLGLLSASPATYADGEPEEGGEPTPIEVLEKNVTHDSQAFDRMAAELTEEHAQDAVQTVAESNFDDLEALSVENKLTLISRLAVFGHTRQLRKMFNTMFDRLTRIPGDRRQFTSNLQAVIVPNAMIQPETGEMWYYLGLLAFTENEAELASVIAHELSHGNPDQLKAGVDDEKTEEFLKSVPGYSDLKSSQREEIRADLGSIDRLILGGYNPWAAVTFERRATRLQQATQRGGISGRVIKFLFRKNMDYWSTHPAGEIRMAAMKAYIMYRSQKVDISELVSKPSPFPRSIQVLRLTRLVPLMRPFASVWFHRALLGSFAVSVLWNLGIQDTEAAKLIADTVAEGSGEVGSFVGEMVKKGFLIGMKIVGGLSALQVVVSFKKARDESRRVKDHYLELVRMAQNRYFSIREGNVRNGAELSSAMATILALLDVFYSTEESEHLTVKDLRYARHMAKHVLKEILLIVEESMSENQWRHHDQRRLVAVLSDVPGLVLEDPYVRNLVRGLVKKAGYSVHPIRSDKGFRSSWEHRNRFRIGNRIRLADFAESHSSQLKPEEALILCESLVEEGMYGLLEKVLNAHLSSMFKHVFDRGVSDPKTFYRLEAIIAASLKWANVDYKGGYRLERLQRAFLKARLKVAHAIGKGLGVGSLSRHLNTKTTSTGAINRVLDFKAMTEIHHKIRTQFKTVRDLVKYVDSELIPRNVDISELVKTLHEQVIKHPEMIQEMEDVSLLLDRSYFWVVLGEERGKLEYELISSIKSMASRFGKAWNFEPAAAEKLQGLIIQKLHSLGQYPQELKDEMLLWGSLTNRGITALTDEMFLKLVERAGPEVKSHLEVLAIEQGRVWEAANKAEVIWWSITNSSDYVALKASSDPSVRGAFLSKVLARIQKLMPERGIYYLDILERISVDIRSSEGEARRIHSARGAQSGEKSEDFTLRLFSAIVATVVEWPESDQWNFINFLRGKAPPGARLKKAFRVVGTTRVLRMFSLLPLTARSTILDTFVASPSGLLGRGGSSFRKNARRMIDDILQGCSPAARQVADEILEAFMVALDKTGNKEMKSYVLSYLLVQESKTKTSGEILKNVLEVLGTTGVKIGQSLIASGILPDEDAQELRSVQELTRVPLRYEMYRDVREVMDQEGPLSFRFGKLLGAASMKYVVEAMNDSGGASVMKVIREDAIANTPFQFKLLHALAQHLVDKHGAKYGVFRTIIKSSEAAVRREMSAADEVERGKIAREQLYKQLSIQSTHIEVPREFLMKARLVVSEFAPGVSVFDLPRKYRSEVAAKILEIEDQLLFREGADEDRIYFDPDRHAGNYRVRVEEVGGRAMIDIRPIDFGQLTYVTVREREQITELFSVAQVLKEVGSSGFLVDQLTQTLSLDSKTARKLTSRLGRYFPMKEMKPITAYYSLLAALDEAGLTPDIRFFDFTRALMQLNQYEVLLTGKKTRPTPFDRFSEAVKNRATELGQGVRGNLGFWGKVKILKGVMQKKIDFSIVESEKLLRPGSLLGRCVRHFSAN